ncbi:Uncharacterised protein [Pannonibacter phragmitetus]|uniref:Uncharacterized protein n=1 Tax=Pannonibacter phragmitetus TaxID=121719 RepID=A0A378ZR06_9HYPH|nr:Uncharacterised protein [Pannonibacter phragmitetus]
MFNRTPVHEIPDTPMFNRSTKVSNSRSSGVSICGCSASPGWGLFGLPD